MNLELPALYVDSAALVATTPRLVLVNRDPSPGETAVPIDATLDLELVDTGLDGVHRASARIWVDGVLAFEGGAPSEIAAAFAGPLAGVVQTADTLRVVLHPVIPLVSLATVHLRVLAQTVGGAASLDEVYSFVVEDRTAPRVVGAQALAQKTVRIAFDEPVLVPPGASFVLTPRSAPAVPVAVSGVKVDGSVVVLTLDTEMTPDVLHEVVAVGVTDLFGNVVLGPYDRATFAGFRPARPPNRRFDLWQMLPKHNRRDDLTGDLARFIACLQEVTDLLLADVDRWSDIFDLERASEGFVDLILRDLGNPFPFELDSMSKRRLASVLVEMYQQKGTARGIQNAVRFFLGIDISAITPFNADTLFLGESELGVDWVLGPSDRFSRYAFNVEVARILAARERQQLRAIVEYLKPAHTHFVDLVEPVPPVLLNHWELGLSDLGETTDLH
ncbi:MAG: phage tail protein [Myxococcales bacterium]|nr:phage tail protein [Myxococcales bacterium]